MTTSVCPIFVQGTTIRATLIDSCGAPVGGACSSIVSDGFISVAMSEQIESPDEYKLKNAHGILDLNQRSQPQLNFITVKVKLTKVMPELVHFLSGMTLIDDADGNAVGVGTDTDTFASASVALEVWTRVGKVRGSSACANGEQWGYLLLPWLLEGTLEDQTIENGPMDWTMDLITSDGNDWGFGPYNVVLNGAGHASPLLSAIPPTRHRHMQLTDVAPPTAGCTCNTLTIPS